MTLLIATGNAGKVRELKKMFSNSNHFEWLFFQDFPDYIAPEETGHTLEANATIKATDAAQKLGYWSLADDSGLFVPALNHEPGVYSARYAGVGATDADNRKKLLAAMQAIPPEQRRAYFECVLVLSNPEGEVVHVTSGRCEGQIIDQERGGQGFGYDPLFIKDDYRETFAELDPEVKNKVSHRFKAAEKMQLYLEKHLPPQ